MPSVRASSRPDLRGWQQAQITPSGEPERHNPPPPPDPLARSPFMRASMPLMASTADAFSRQFYSENGLPSQRILPAKKGSGT